MTPDQGQRFMFDGHPVRGQMACIETTLAEVFGRHSYPARVAEQLGEALVAVARHRAGANRQQRAAQAVSGCMLHGFCARGRSH